jgi:deuterolysin
MLNGSLTNNLSFEESKVAFEGIRLMIQYKDLAEDNFQTLAAGKSLEATFDLAELHDLSVGGSFDIKTAGQLSYAAANSNELAGSFAYSSNVVSASVDGAAAEKTRRSFLDNIARRSAVQSDCTSTRRTSTVNALANCATLARAAASAATSNSAKLNEYFKSTSSSVASAVSSVFSRVATECASSTGGVSRTYCTVSQMSDSSTKSNTR